MPSRLIHLRFGIAGVACSMSFSAVRKSTDIDKVTCCQCLRVEIRYLRKHDGK